jgi:hypothetical protein
MIELNKTLVESFADDRALESKKKGEHTL